MQLFPNPSNGRVMLLQHANIMISGVYDVFGQRIEKTISAAGTELIYRKMEKEFILLN